MKTILFLFLLMSSLLARGGDFELGEKFYKSGDFSGAFGYWQSEVQKGNPYAIVNVGSLYYFGKGVSQSYANAFTHYKNASAHKIPEAQHLLGKMYLSGLGVEKNVPKGLAWMRVARDQGFDNQEFINRTLETTNIVDRSTSESYFVRCRELEFTKCDF